MLKHQSNLSHPPASVKVLKVAGEQRHLPREHGRRGGGQEGQGEEPHQLLGEEPHQLLEQPHQLLDHVSF